MDYEEIRQMINALPYDRLILWLEVVARLKLQAQSSVLEEAKKQ